VEAAMEKYAEDFAPLTDMRATAEYRALAARNLLLRFYTETTGTSAPFQVSRYEAA
jgi:xanthine dehydrogenase small subunit